LDEAFEDKHSIFLPAQHVFSLFEVLVGAEVLRCGSGAKWFGALRQVCGRENAKGTTHTPLTASAGKWAVGFFKGNFSTGIFIQLKVRNTASL
jgi:hypothetical protein